MSEATDYADRAYAEMMESEAGMTGKWRMAEPAVGAWVSMCCEIDLHQITDEEEVADIKASIAEAAEMYEHPVHHVWATKEEALADLGV